jgi:hypothetical protein
MSDTLIRQRSGRLTRGAYRSCLALESDASGGRGAGRHLSISCWIGGDWFIERVACTLPRGD